MHHILIDNAMQNRPKSDRLAHGVYCQPIEARYPIRETSQA